MTWSEFVKALTPQEMRQMIEDYEQLERDGVIGDCLLRSKAEEWAKQLKGTHNTILWMDRLAAVCYRFFARRYLTEVL